MSAYKNNDHLTNYNKSLISLTIINHEQAAMVLHEIELQEVITFPAQSREGGQSIRVKKGVCDQEIRSSKNLILGNARR